ASTSRTASARASRPRRERRHRAPSQRRQPPRSAGRDDAAMDLDRYPNISAHGLIGDLQTAALVTTDGTIDFFCCPRFDSPSVFASLLDANRGGYFRIGPAGDRYVTRHLYF